ncbi:MAG TPA: hypothetical protein DCE41_24935 [Cytophagales bacterium]|nr:hypothetical protein [Cytophagales bacterium]HAA23219.1 hypothetical protein [Cytophagales bacterium]HAP58493.1 hypothetical protein [Cytophagales bacterium]
MARGQNSLFTLGYGLILTAIIWIAIRVAKLIPLAFDISRGDGWRSFAAAILPILAILIYRLMSEKNLLDVFFGNRYLTLIFSIALGFGFLAYLELEQIKSPWHELVLGLVIGILIDLLFFSHKLDRRWVALSGLALYLGGVLHVVLFGISWL